MKAAFEQHIRNCLAVGVLPSTAYDFANRFRSLSEHGADAGTPVSGPSHCSPASPRAGDKGDGLEGKPPVPRRVGEPGNVANLPRSEAE
jgi:hypothetical protein